MTGRQRSVRRHAQPTSGLLLRRPLVGFYSAVDRDLYADGPMDVRNASSMTPSPAANKLPLSERLSPKKTIFCSERESADWGMGLTSTD